MPERTGQPDSCPWWPAHPSRQTREHPAGPCPAPEVVLRGLTMPWDQAGRAPGRNLTVPPVLPLGHMPPGQAAPGGLGHPPHHPPREPATALPRPEGSRDKRAPVLSLAPWAPAMVRPSRTGTSGWQRPQGADRSCRPCQSHSLLSSPVGVHWCPWLLSWGRTPG